MNKLYLAADHNGIEILKELEMFLNSKGYIFENLSKEFDPNDDYVDSAVKLCNKVINDNSLGVLVCGTGIGMSIAANKIKGIRAAKCDNKKDSHLAKEHNHANVICLSSRKDSNEINEMVEEFILTKYSNEERHERRVNKIINLEK